MDKKGFIVWYPKIHKIYGETLYFFLLDTGTFYEETKHKIEKILEECGIKGRCIYGIFGRHDFLLRVWLKPEKRERFKKRIDEEPFLKAINEFETDKSNHHLWRNHSLNDKNEEEISKIIFKYNTEDLIDLQNKIGKGEESPNNELFNKLKEEGIVSPVFYEETNSEKIKFYVILNYNFDKVSFQKTIKDRLKKHLNEVNTVECISLYAGKGFASFLIKGVVEKFYSIHPFILNLTNEFRDIDITSQTLIITQSLQNESDDVDFIEISGIGETEKKEIMGFLKITNSSLLTQNLNQVEQHRLIDTFRKINDKLPNSKEEGREIIENMFMGFIEKKESDIKKEMILLFEVEGLLRKFFWQTAATFDIDDLIKATKIEKDAKGFGFYEYVCLLGKIDSKGGKIKDALGEGWEKILRDASVLRNDFAHSKISNLLDKWEGTVMLFIDLIPIYNILCKEAKEKNENFAGNQ